MEYGYGSFVNYTDLEALSSDWAGRVAGELETGSWACENNQNVVCENPVRYTVEDSEAWQNMFPTVESNEDSSIGMVERWLKTDRTLVSQSKR